MYLNLILIVLLLNKFYTFVIEYIYKIIEIYIIMNDYRLAIVIPAYKHDFLADTLKSLSEQTDKRFNVYIGDDASPFDLYSIVKDFNDKISIKYKFFHDNLGGKDLVAQWNRCIDLIEGEEFFMLFSDDDVMSSDCIENFYKSIETNHNFDVYHFDINIIDSEGNVKVKCPKYPELLSSYDFFSMLYNHKKIDARMPEFIFRTECFNRTGGFVGFDLAYRTDNATVMNCAKEKGIYTVQNSTVLWRDSGINVSSAKNIPPAVSYKKCKATIEFFNWVDAFLKDIDKCWPISVFRRSRIIIKNLLPVYKSMGKADGIELLNNLFEIKKSRTVCLYYHFMLKIYMILK